MLILQKLGFASCERNPGATEGINVLVEKKNHDGKWEYGISCIEYTEFDKFGISNGPISKHRYYKFPYSFDKKSDKDVFI